MEATLSTIEQILITGGILYGVVNLFMFIIYIGLCFGNYVRYIDTPLLEQFTIEPVLYDDYEFNRFNIVGQSILIIVTTLLFLPAHILLWAWDILYYLWKIISYYFNKLFLKKEVK